MRNSLVILLLVVFCANLVGVRAVFSLTLKEEEELSEDILKVIFRHYEVIEDPVVNEYVNQVGRRILASLPEQPFKYRFFVLKEDVYNAFAIPAGYIFINSGLFEAMDTEEELAGILGHEIAHVYCRHISEKIERSRKIGLATLAGMAAGVLLGAAGGSGAAAQALTMGSAAAGQSAELAYSRENELQADQMGLQFLSKAHYNGEGLLDVLKKIRSKQWFGSDQVPTYLMTHPAVEDRIAYIDTWLESHPNLSKANPPVDPSDFDRVHARLLIEYGEPEIVLKQMADQVKKTPDDPVAHYRYGLILARVGKREEAVNELRTALSKRVFDPYILRDLGRVYFLDGKLAEAAKTLETACGMIPADPECAFYLARTNLESGNDLEASEILLKLVEDHPDYKAAYYFLGRSLGKAGREGEAYYYLGVYHQKNGDYKTAQAQFKRALEKTTDPGQRQRIEDLLREIEKASSGQKESGG
jgi:predicted Zn-dependent protease